MYQKINVLELLYIQNDYHVVLDFYRFYNIGRRLLYICAGRRDNTRNSLVHGILRRKRTRMSESH